MLKTVFLAPFTFLQHFCSCKLTFFEMYQYQGKYGQDVRWHECCLQLDVCMHRVFLLYLINTQKTQQIVHDSPFLQIPIQLYVNVSIPDMNVPKHQSKMSQIVCDLIHCIYNSPLTWVTSHCVLSLHTIFIVTMAIPSIEVTEVRTSVFFF